MKPNDFAYARAQSVEHALGLLAEAGGEAQVLAGGQSLLATLNMRLSAPSLLVDINRLEELRGIALHGDRLHIGALTRHVDLQRSPLVAEHAPLLAHAVEHVAHAAVRNRGTIGGNVALADPASELPACLVALDAQITIRGAGGKRQVPARQFFRALYQTDLQEQELLLAVNVPAATPASAWAFREFVRRRGDFAVAGLALSAKRDADTLREVSPVFFGISATPALVAGTAQILEGQALTDARIREARVSLDTELDVMASAQNSAAFKRHLAGHFLADVMRQLRDSPAH